MMGLPYSLAAFAPPRDTGSPLNGMNVRKGAIPWRRNAPLNTHASGSGPHHSTNTPLVTRSFAHFSRNQARRAAFEAALADINERFGGESRRARRRMASRISRQVVRGAMAAAAKGGAQ